MFALKDWFYLEVYKMYHIYGFTIEVSKIGRAGRGGGGGGGGVEERHPSPLIS